MSRPVLLRCTSCLLLLGLLLGAACAVNPVTGKRQIVLMSESQEIAMGQQAAPQIAATMGIYDDADLQRYVERIGLGMARSSERPQLPWQFRVVDDSLVNAFAVPGGFVYVTRGILAYFDDEAQLASVLGHEIGHVTARHSVAQYTKQMGAQLVLLPTIVLVPELANASQLIGAGLQVLLLKYSRDDESQSDELGLAYMTRAGYAATEMPKVFHTLDRIGEKSGTDGIPEWLSSHPKPANRESVMKALIARLPNGGQGRIGRKEYMEHIDGLVYGDDPRQGYFGDDAVFHHPELAFRIAFPEGWKLVNQHTLVGAVEPGQKAAVQVTLDEQKTPQAAASAFVSGEGIQSTRPRSETIGGLPAVTLDFLASSQGGAVRGMAAFVAYGDHVYRMLGLAPQAGFASYESVLRGTLYSFQRERSAAVLAVQPWRIEIVTPSRDYGIDGFAQAYPGPVGAEELALLNGIDAGTRYARGVLFKRVVGKPLP
jgi:predicted Zn-dependent protease